MENKVELILEELAFHLETLISFWLLVLRRGFSYDNQFERSRRQCASGQITSNILTQASWRLYEITQPPTSLCTTSNSLINLQLPHDHHGCPSRNDCHGRQ